MHTGSINDNSAKQSLESVKTTPMWNEKRVLKYYAIYSFVKNT